MDWLRQAAAQLREWLAQQAWFDGWQSSIAQTPDWALLAAGPATLLLFALLLRITRPGSRTSDTEPKTPQAQKQSRPQASANVAPSPATTKSSPAPVPAGNPVPVQPAALRAPAQMADDDEDNRSVRVFVSSTFLDMQTERDELVTKTFPALRAKYRARGVELFEVDLRWGITSEMQERGDTLPTLLSEIDRCRPYFIGLLGDRYGWVPPPEALTDKLKTDYPAIADAQGASVTAMEIMHGVLSNADTAARAFFFERDPKWGWIATLNDADRLAATGEPDAARVKLAELKTLIRQKAHVEAYARPEDIGKKVTDALDALLEARFPEAQAPDAFEQSARLHRAYARERRGLHVGAEGYLSDLTRWMETKEAPLMLIGGASGGGKSTLVANWLHARRKDHPNDIVFEHYLGASPESADPMLLLRRMWEHVNRASGETVDLPDANAELMDVSAGLAQRLARARATADRGSANLLIVLDGLDKLSSEQNLRWLPIVPSVHVLVSSLDGEPKSAALARGFFLLEVKPLTEQQRQEFIVGTLARWRRELEPQHIVRILQPAAAELAGSPLYLKTVLDELRVSADNARLAQRLEDYRGARHMPDLFDRVLRRLEDDCEPGLVALALPLIWASRAGLEETEIVSMTGATPLGWATLRNGLGEGFRDQAGRLAFSHDYLKEAVAARYLPSVDQQRVIHLAIADQFDKHDADERQAEELPFQLRAAQAWDRLEAFLVDLDRFELLRARGDGELLSYWLALDTLERRPEPLLCGAFDARAGDPARWGEAEVYLAFSVAEFLRFAGAQGEAFQNLSERRTAASTRVLGPDHPHTLISMASSSEIFFQRRDLEHAERVTREVLETRTRVLGPEHPDTLSSTISLAMLLQEHGDLEGAQELKQQTLEVSTRVFGPEHPNTLSWTRTLANTLAKRRDLAGAQKLCERVVEVSTRRLGPEHPDTINAMDDLAAIHSRRDDHIGARALFERTLEARVRLLGEEHPQTLDTMADLAVTLSELGNLDGAQKLQERAHMARLSRLGPHHPGTLSGMMLLARTLRSRGDFDGAQKLQSDVLEVRTRVLGREHPDTLSSMHNLALTLQGRRDLDAAYQLQNEVLEIRKRIFGPEHPDTLDSIGILALINVSRGDFTGAQELLRGVLDVEIRRLGKDHDGTLTTMANLAQVLFSGGDLVGAQKLQQELLEARTRALGPEHPSTRVAVEDLAEMKTSLRS
jgi:tetratricopeptide (TPR) repeat protein